MFLVLAAVAEYEARLISERTKAAFAAAKARGRKFGNPNPRRIVSPPRRERPKSARCERAKARALDYLPLLCRLRDSGETLHGIALQLTMMEIETPGKCNVWRDRAVAKMFEYAGKRKPRPRASRRTQADRRAAQLNFQLTEHFLDKLMVLVSITGRMGDARRPSATICDLE